MSHYARAFREMHASGLFVMPNPWDAGTARLLADLGFSALASSSAALAWSLGRRDGSVTREEAIGHARALSEAAGLPVNGDFEGGYGATPAEVAETLRQAVAAGVAGCSVEDQDPSGALFPLDEARRRFAAAREAASGSAFVLTGRTEVFFQTHPDPLTEAIRRLQAYEAEGADVVYAPGLASEEQVRAVVSAVKVPVNVLCGFGGASDDLAALARLGVRRVSIGSGLARVALGAFLRAAGALKDGRVAFEGAVSSRRLHEVFGKP